RALAFSWQVGDEAPRPGAGSLLGAGGGDGPAVSSAGDGGDRHQRFAQVVRSAARRRAFGAAVPARGGDPDPGGGRISIRIRLYAGPGPFAVPAQPPIGGNSGGDRRR